MICRTFGNPGGFRFPAWWYLPKNKWRALPPARALAPNETTFIRPPIRFTTFASSNCRALLTSLGQSTCSVWMKVRWDKWKGIVRVRPGNVLHVYIYIQLGAPPLSRENSERLNLTVYLSFRDLARDLSQNPVLKNCKPQPDYTSYRKPHLSRQKIGIPAI